MQPYRNSPTPSKQTALHCTDLFSDCNQEMELHQLPSFTNQPYDTSANVEALLSMAQPGASFEQSIDLTSGTVEHAWPSDRLALAGCKVEVRVQIDTDTIALGKLPRTPQDQWPTELGKRLLRSVKVWVGDATLAEGAGAHFPFAVEQFAESVECPNVAYSVVWTLPVSAPIPLFTPLNVKIETAPFELWNVVSASLIPRYVVIEPVASADVLLERNTVHQRFVQESFVRVPLVPRLTQVKLYAEGTPVRRAVVYRNNQSILALSDRAMRKETVDLRSLDCSGCELAFELDPNEHLKRSAQPRSALAVRLTTEQVLHSCAEQTHWVSAPLYRAESNLEGSALFQTE